MRATRFTAIRIAILGLLPFPILLAQSQQTSAYPETGTVKLLVSNIGTLRDTQYLITTSHAIYRVQCTRFKSDKSQEPDCSFDHTAITSGSTISFRIQDDSLWLPADDQGHEQQLLISTTELNPYPATPAPETNGVENGIVVAVGNYKNEQYTSPQMRDRCASLPPAQTAGPKVPESALPVPQVDGKSSSSNTQVFGGVMTSEQQDNLLCIANSRPRLDSFKLITSDRVYEVVCVNEGPCQVHGQPLQLGGNS